MTEPLWAIAAVFETPQQLLEAARELRRRGVERLDALSPFPVHGMDRVLGYRVPPLGWVVLVAAVVGASLALALQWWTGAIDYPLHVGGKPLFAWEFSVPVTFELAVLLGAFAAFGGMLWVNRLPQYEHPVLCVDGLARVSTDEFVLVVEASDSQFDENRMTRWLQELGAVRVERIPGRGES